MKKVLIKGFTLVELLIVMALIAILAAALVATLDPIEQINKARDARITNDSAEVLAGIERFYASIQEYPWEGWQDDVSSNDAVGYHSGMNGMGICGSVNERNDTGEDSDAIATTCNSTSTTGDVGVLIDAKELKGAFANKAEFQNMIASPTDWGEGLYLYHDGTGNIYVCFVPKSKTYRQNKSKLRCIDATGGVADNYAQEDGTNCVAPASAGDEAWDFDGTSTEAIFVCSPE